MTAKWPISVATDADLYTAVNALATTLASTITDSQATISLASTTGFPTAGAVLIDQEIVFYTNISGNDLTGCVRGSDGTTQAAHTAGVPVSHMVVAFHHNGLKDEIEAIETSLNLTASRALASSASGRVEVSTVTAAELAYLSGVTSAIQAQLNGKQPAGTYIANPLTADLSAAGTYKITNLAAGTTSGDALRYEQVIGQFLLLSGGTLTGALLHSSGSVSAPALSFSADTDTGLYLSADGQLGLACAGTLVGLFTSTAFRAQQQFRAINGSATVPSITFINDSDTGFSRINTGQILVINDGTLNWSFDVAGNISSQGSSGRIHAGNGLVGSPAYSFSGATGYGMWWNGGNDLNFSTNGTLALSVQTGLIQCYRDTIPATDNTHTLGKTGNRWTAVWAANGTIQTSMSDTKENIVELAPEECTVPVPAKFNRPGEDPTKPRLGWIADSLPAEAHPVGEDGDRVADCIYTDAVLAQLCLAARNDYDRLAAIDAKVAALEAENSALQERLALLEAPQE